MQYRGSVVACVLASIAGCASATSPAEGTDAPLGGVDARSDAPGQIDASQQIDASCNPITTQLLTNQAFDATPLATGWTETRIDPAYGIVVATGGVAAMSPANKAWLGGLERPTASNKDALTQDVAIPAGTTQLVLSGSYQVQTSELLALVYDTGKVEVLTTGNSVVDATLTITNVTTATTWTAFTKTLATPHAGETLRIKLSSASDATYPTNFFFDSLKLEATAPASGCP